MLSINKLKIKKLLAFCLIIIGCESSSDIAVGSNGFSNESLGSASGTGIGGSMARFTIVDDYLYTVDSYKLISFDIQDQINPVMKEEVSLGWGIETIFPYEDKLFIGAQNGMHIYGLSNKEKPKSNIYLKNT